MVRGAHAEPGKRVLFVCTGNFYRSRFAEALFNASAPPGWTAFSRGLDTSTPRLTPVSPLVVAELARRHVDAKLEASPQPLTRRDLDAADLVVLLDDGEHRPMLASQFPGYPQANVRGWSVADVPKVAPPLAFAAIAAQTEALVRSLR